MSTNVTVVVPNALRAAVEGRRQVSLGLPASADVGDVIETLLKLYPKLQRHLASDKRPEQPSFSFFIGEQATRELARRKAGIREGSRLYLVASSPRRAADGEG